MTLVVTTLTSGGLAPQSFVVPLGVTELDVLIFGASGGGTQVVGHPAGWGPIFHGDLAVTPGETLTVQVGRGGTGIGIGIGANPNAGIGGYPDGGTGGLGPTFNKGGGGGGSSRIWRSGVGGTLLVLVPGGGGLGAVRNDSPNPGIGNGVVPAGETIIGTASTKIGHNVLHTGGRPAATGVGGAGGTGGTLNGNAGSSFDGGDGRAGTGTVNISLIPSGGGGGGGFFGGGGGASGTSIAGSGRAGGQGGGGIGFIDLSQGWSDTTWDTTPPLDIGTGSGFFRQGTVILTYNVPSPGGWSLGLVSRRRTPAAPAVFGFPYFVDFTGLSELPTGWVTNAGHTLHVDGVTGFPAITFDNVAVPAGSSTIVVHAKALNTSEDTTVSISSTIGGETISVQNWPWDFDDKTGHCNGDGSSTSVSLAAPDNSRHLWTAAVLAPTQRHIYVADAAGFAHNSAATTAITHTFGSISINATARLCQLYVATTALTQAQIEDIWAMMGLV